MLSIFFIAVVLIFSTSALPPFVFDPRIVGGEEVQRNELPYQVSLQRYGSHFCGGVIYNKDFILTAAHCVPTRNVESLSVVAGEHSLDAADGTEQAQSVKAITIHPYYDAETMQHDIAILELNTPLEFNAAVANIKLPALNHLATGTGVVSGWGAIEEDGGAATILRKVSVPLISDVKCQEYYGLNNQYPPAMIYPSMLCAGFEKGGKDSCQGDSGGPLAVGSGDDRYLAGIVSWGYGCAIPNYPGVYTEVSHYLEFIEGNAPHRNSAVSLKFLASQLFLSCVPLLFTIIKM